MRPGVNRDGYFASGERGSIPPGPTPGDRTAGMGPAYYSAAGCLTSGRTCVLWLPFV